MFYVYLKFLTFTSFLIICLEYQPFVRNSVYCLIITNSFKKISLFVIFIRKRNVLKFVKEMYQSRTIFVELNLKLNSHTSAIY